jgi:hypothetical protein
MILEQMTQSEFNAILDPIEQFARNARASGKNIKDAIHDAVDERSRVWSWDFMRSIKFLHYARDNHPNQYGETIDIVDCMGEDQIGDICYWLLFVLTETRILGAR